MGEKNTSELYIWINLVSMVNKSGEQDKLSVEITTWTSRIPMSLCK